MCFYLGQLLAVGVDGGSNGAARVWVSEVNTVLCFPGLLCFNTVLILCSSTSCKIGRSEVSLKASAVETSAHAGYSDRMGTACTKLSLELKQELPASQRTKHLPYVLNTS